MRKNNLYNIGDIIRNLMKNPKISHKLDKLNVLEIWNEIIGKGLQNYVSDQKIYDNILYVKLKSSVVRNELSYKKSEIRDRINKRFGKIIIKEIVLK